MTLAGLLRGDSSQYSLILSRLRKHDDAYPFLRPVDWKRLGLTDYPEVIRTPMDLQTIGRRVRDGVYDGKPQEFLDALQLIWTNCKTYNDPDTEVYEMAVKMEQHVGETIDQIVAQDGGGSGGGSTGIESKRRRTGGGKTSEQGGGAPETPDSSKQSTKKPKKQTMEEMVEPPQQQPIKQEEVFQSGTRRDLMNKLIIRFRRLTPKNAGLVLGMIFREQEAGSLPANITTQPRTTSVPHTSPSASTRRATAAKGGSGGGGGELVDVNLNELDDNDMKRLCSVVKCFLFKQSIDVAAS